MKIETSLLTAIMVAVIAPSMFAQSPDDKKKSVFKRRIEARAPKPEIDTARVGKPFADTAKTKIRGSRKLNPDYCPPCGRG